MTSDEAKLVVKNDSAGFNQWVRAVGVLTSSAETSLADLIYCLRRPGLPAEMAATALYSRTGRPRSSGSVDSFVLDPEDWMKYIVTHGLV